MDEHIHHLTKKPVACLQQWISAFSDTQKAKGELRVNHTVDCYLAIKMNKVDFYMLTYTDVQIILWIVQGKNYDTGSIMMPLKVLFFEECNLVQKIPKLPKSS